MVARPRRGLQWQAALDVSYLTVPPALFTLAHASHHENQLLLVGYSSLGRAHLGSEREGRQQR
jgi:hypothetical protein